jgi:uncharacterized protein (DUF433 family)
VRRPALLPLIPAVLLALTACDPEHAGSAATVGGHRLALGDLKDATASGFVHYAPKDTSGAPTAKGTRADFQRIVLSRSIRDVLIDDVAAQLGVKVTATQVDQAVVLIDQRLGSHKALLSSAAAQGYAPDQLVQEIKAETETSAISAQLLKEHPVTEETIQAYYAAHASQFASDDIAIIEVADQALAQQLLTSTKADPTTFAAQAKAHSIDTTSAASGGEQGTKPAGTYPADIESAIFAAKAGDVLGPFAVQGSSGTTAYVLVHVTSVTKKSLAQTRSTIESTLSAADGTYVQGLYVAAVTAQAKKVRVHVSSRFGVWDASRVTVIATGANPQTALSVTGRNDTVAPATDQTTPATTP